MMKRSLNIAGDVIELSDPLLVSLRLIRSLKCMIHLGEWGIIWGDLSETPLRVAANKHLTASWYPALEIEKSLLARNVENAIQPRGAGRMKRLRIHLGHAGVGVMKRTLQNAGGEVTDVELRETAQTCDAM